MINKRLVVSLAFVMLAPSYVKAETFFTENWGEVKDGLAVTFSLLKSSEKEYHADIGHNKSGKQSIYISILDGDKDLCDPSKFPSDGVSLIQGQAVKVMAWCKSYSDSKNHFLQFTPLTNAGDEFLYNAFKSSPYVVNFKFLGESFDISAVGFQAEWDKAGGDAL